MSQSNTEKRPTQPRNSFLIAVVGAVFWGMALVIIWNSYLWYAKGYEATVAQISAHYDDYLAKLSSRSNIISRAFIDLIELIENYLAKGLNHLEERLMDETNGLSHSLEGEFKRVGIEIGIFLIQLVGILWASIKLTLIKFFTISASIILYVLSALVGAVDGLRARYIRTVEGGRESTFIFHRIGSLVVKVPVLILLLYIAIPFYFSPWIAVTGISILFWFFFYVTTSNLKKFL